MKAPVVLLLLVLSSPVVLAQQQFPDGWDSWVPPPPKEPMGDNYTSLPLRWNADEGRGAIYWSNVSVAAPFDDDPGGPVAPFSVDARGAQSALGPLARSTVGDPGGWVLEHEWISVPAPRTLYLDANRTARLLLYLQAPSCGSTSALPRIDAHLYLDGKPLGVYFEPRYPNQAGNPPNPVGYCSLVMRIPLESDVIAKDLVLKIVLRQAVDSYTGASRPRPYGMVGFHQSALDLPTLPWDEVVARRPEFVDGPWVPEDALPYAAGSLWAAALALLLGTVPRRRLVLVLLVLMVPLAGCMGSSPTGTDATKADATKPAGRIEEDFLPGDDTGLTGDGVAAVVGSVRDANAAPISQAVVQLLRSAEYAISNRHGTFVLREVAPGTHRLRVDADGFRPYEGDVTIHGGSYTRLRIFLESVAPLDRDARPHDHDLFRDQATLEIPPIEFSFQTIQKVGYYRVGGSGARSSCTDAPSHNGDVLEIKRHLCTQEIRPIVERSPVSPIVAPGTARITMRFEWSDRGARPVPALGLMFQHAGDHEHWRMLAPRASGEAFEIPVAWETSDTGHQRFTFWRFMAYAETLPGTVMDLPDRVRVKTTLHKGVLPYEPPHVDLWEGNATYAYIPQNVRTFISGNPIWCQGRIASDAQQELMGAATGSTPWRRTDPEELGCRFELGTWRRFVPEGTRWLEVRVNSTYQSTATAAVTMPDAPWVLRYATAVHPPSDDVPPRVAPQVRDPTPYPATTPTSMTYHFRLCLQPDDPDPFYAQVTTWRFEISDGREGPERGTATARWFSLHAVAHREPHPTCG